MNEQKQTAVAGPVETTIRPPDTAHKVDSSRLIHISLGGPERWLSCAGKLWVFEDHPHCGPIVLTSKTRDPDENQPPESSLFWQHVNAWYAQGKRTKEVGGKIWCVYETQMQEARRRGRIFRLNT